MARIEDLRKRMKDAGIIPKKTEERKVRTNYSPEEMSTLAARMAEHVLEGKRLEDEKKAVTKVLKDKQEKEEEAAQALAELYECGYEDMEENCLIGIDIANGVRIIVCIRTGLEVSREMLQDGDMQAEMPLDEAPETEAAEVVVKPKRAPTLEIGLDRGRADGPIEVEGIVVDDEIYKQAGEGEKEPQKAEEIIVTQIRLTEERSGFKGVCFATTAEGIILFTEDARFSEMLGLAVESKTYVAITYDNSHDTRNKRIVDIEERDAAPTMSTTDIERLAVPLPEGDYEEIDEE